MDTIGLGTHATYARDGITTTDPPAFVEFMAEEFYKVAYWGMIQCAEELGVIIDPDVFISAFTYKKDGKQFSVRHGPHLPGYRRHDAPTELNPPHIEVKDDFVDQTPLRLAAFAEMEELRDKMAKMTPYNINHQTPAYTDEDIAKIIDQHDKKRKQDFSGAPCYGIRLNGGESVAKGAEIEREYARSRKAVEKDDDSEYSDDGFIENEEYRRLVDNEGNSSFRRAKEEKSSRRTARHEKRRAKKAQEQTNRPAEGTPSTDKREKRKEYDDGMTLSEGILTEDNGHKGNDEEWLPSTSTANVAGPDGNPRRSHRKRSRTSKSLQTHPNTSEGDHDKEAAYAFTSPSE